MVVGEVARWVEVGSWCSIYSGVLGGPWCWLVVLGDMVLTGGWETGVIVVKIHPNVVLD